MPLLSSWKLVSWWSLGDLSSCCGRLVSHCHPKTLMKSITTLLSVARRQTAEPGAFFTQDQDSRGSTAFYETWTVNKLPNFSRPQFPLAIPIIVRPACKHAGESKLHWWTSHTCRGLNYVLQLSHLTTPCDNFPLSILLESCLLG